jgi:hypothetical protein
VKRPIIPILMLILGLALILGAVLLVVALSLPQRASTQSISTPQEQAGEDGLVYETQAPDGQIPRLTVAAAKAAYDRQEAVFLDVRGDTYYAQQHIPGALSISAAALEERIDELDPNAWIITYCT